MDVQVTGLRVTAVDHHLEGIGSHQRARHGHAGVVIGGDAHLRAVLEPARITIGGQMGHRRGRRLGGHFESFFGAHGRRCAVAQGHDAVIPAEQGGQAQEPIDLGRAVLAQQENGLPAGQIGGAGCIAQDETTTFQRLHQPGDLRAHELHMLLKLGRHRFFGNVDAQIALLAVLEEFGRDVLTDVMHQHTDGRNPHLALPGKTDRARQPLAARGQQRGFRADAVKRSDDGVRVAINVGAHLQHRRAAVTARQRREQRPRRHARNVDRTPGQLLEAQRGADLFRKGRELVVVKDDVVHGLSPEMA